MTFIGSSRSQSSTYFSEKLESGRNKIKDFPNLNKISNNFKSATRENHIGNFMLNLLAYLDSTKSPEADIWKIKLTKIDRLIGELTTKLPKEKKNKLISILNSFEEENYKLLYELELYIELEENPHVSKIFYVEEEIGNHDFRIMVDSEELNIELTSLGKSIIQQEIEEGFRQAAQRIIKSIPERTYLQITVDSDKLLNGSKVATQKVREVLLNAYKLIEKVLLVDLNGLCIIENFQSRNKSLYELKDYYDYYQEYGQRLTKLLQSEDGLLFLKNTKADDLKSCPIISFIVGPAKWGSVNITTQRMQPSIAEDLRKKSLIGQLKRSIIQKIKKGQLIDKANPIIAIRFEDFAFMHYGSESDYWGEESFMELMGIIEECFLETKEKKILGVIIFENTLKKFRFIKNPNILLNNEILNKINILKE